MKISNEILTFSGIVLLSLLVTTVFASGSSEMILNIRAIENSESSAYVQSDSEYELNNDISVTYVLKIQGGSTSTYTVRREDGITHVTYNLTDSVVNINNAKVNSIRQYALDTWGFIMSKGNVYYKSYSKGS